MVLLMLLPSTQIYFRIWNLYLILLVNIIMNIYQVYQGDLSFFLFVLIYRMKILINYVQHLYLLSLVVTCRISLCP